MSSYSIKLGKCVFIKYETTLINKSVHIEAELEFPRKDLDQVKAVVELIDHLGFDDNASLVMAAREDYLKHHAR